MTSQSIRPLKSDTIELGDTMESSLKHRFLLVVSGLLFVGYLVNILLGVSAVRFDSGVFYLSDVYEAAMLFGSVSTAMIFVLLNDEND